MTLLEVLLAIGLACFLFLAVFESLFLATRYRSQIENSHSFELQMSNAIMDMQSDLNAMNPSLSNRPAIAGASVPGEILIQEKLAFRDSFSNANALDWVDFVGGSDHFAFRAHGVNPRFQRTTRDVLPAESCEIVWRCAGSSQSIECWKAGDIQVAKPLVLPHPDSGLMRIQIMRDMHGAEKQFGLCMNPGLSKIELKYFDGERLRSEWSSLRDGGVPRSIQVRLIKDGIVSEHWLSIPAISKEGAN